MDDEIGVSAAQVIEMVSAQFKTLRPGEITIRMYMEQEGLRYQQAEYRLNKLVELGMMKKRLILDSGARRSAFSWIGGQSDGHK